VTSDPVLVKLPLTSTVCWVLLDAAVLKAASVVTVTVGPLPPPVVLPFTVAYPCGAGAAAWAEVLPMMPAVATAVVTAPIEARAVTILRVAGRVLVLTVVLRGEREGILKSFQEIIFLK
jgi:hypothetical protein